MTKDIKAKINSLRHSINEHNYAYYVLDNPILSDQEYDALFRELEQLEKENPEFIDPLSPTQRVGHPVNSDLESIPHITPMLSLSNAINNEEISDFNKRINKWLNRENISYVAEPKIDGLGVSLVYKNGQLNKAKDICIEILKIDPENIDVLYLLAVIALQFKNYSKSRDYLLENKTLLNIRANILMTVPIIDVLVSPEESLDACSKMANCTHITYKTSRHEMYLERDEIRDTWLKDITKWIREKS